MRIYGIVSGCPHSTNDLGFTSRVFSVEFAFSPCVCAGSLQVLWLPTTIQRHLRDQKFTHPQYEDSQYCEDQLKTSHILKQLNLTQTLC